MGRGNDPAKEVPKPPAPDYAAVAKPSPVQSELENQALQTLKWASKGDFRDPRAGGLFVNFADPARSARQYELTSNAGRQGISALGTPDPNYLAAVKENERAHMAENAGAQYESDIKEGVGAAKGLGLNLANLSADDRRAILASQTGIYGGWQGGMLGRPKQPKWWESLLSGAAAAAPAAIEAI